MFLGAATILLLVSLTNKVTEIKFLMVIKTGERIVPSGRRYLTSFSGDDPDYFSIFTSLNHFDQKTTLHAHLCFCHPGHPPRAYKLLRRGRYTGSSAYRKPLAHPGVIGLFGDTTKIAHHLDCGKHVSGLRNWLLISTGCPQTRCAQRHFSAADQDHHRPPDFLHTGRGDCRALQYQASRTDGSEGHTLF